MANLTRAELSAHARQAGFTDTQIPVIVAIALAESGGDPKAHNATPPDDSYGLLQINMLGKLGPDRRKRFNLKSNDDLYDPATNFRVGHGIFKGSGFDAWTTYTRGTYKKHLGADSAGNITSGVTGAVGDAVSGLNPITGVSEAINAFGSTLFKTGTNLAGVGAAIAFIVIGVVVLMRGQISNVLPAKKALKIAKAVTK